MNFLQIRSRLQGALYRANQNFIPPGTQYGSTSGIKGTGNQPLNLTALQNVPSGNPVTLNVSGGAPFEITYAPIFNVGDNLIGPGNGTGGTGTWNGAAESGYGNWLEDGIVQTTVPQQVTRTFGKPTLVNNTPVGQRFSSNFVISVDASAVSGGGITKVRFYVEGRYIDVTQRTVYHYQDADGVWRALEGYHITLNAAAFLALSPNNNSANIFVRAYANNPLFQTQLIGVSLATSNAIDDTTPTTAANGFKRRMIFYPESTQYSTLQLQVAPSLSVVAGSRYKTIEDCLNYVRDQGNVTGAYAPLITIMESGFYDPVNTTTSAWVNLRGYATITTANSVTATIGRSTFKTTSTNGVRDAAWRPGLAKLHFMGPGVVFDHSNWLDTQNTTTPTIFDFGDIPSNPAPPSWYDGITVGAATDLSSHLGPDGKYWIIPGPEIATECSFSFGGTKTRSVLARNNSYTNLIGGSLFNNTPSVVGNYLSSLDSTSATRSLRALNIQYNGGQASGLFSKSLDNSGTLTTLSLVYGVTTRTTTQALWKVSDVVTWINSFTADGWVASIGADTTASDSVTDRNAAYIDTTTSLNCKSVNQVVNTSFTLASKFYDFQVNNADATKGPVNCLIKNNVLINHVNLEVFSGTTPATDTWFINLFSAHSSGSASSKWLSLSPTVHKNSGLLYCVDSLTFLDSANAGDGTGKDALCQHVGCVHGQVTWNGGTTNATTIPAYVDCHLIGGANGGGILTNVSTGDTFNNMFPSYQAGDYSPAGALVQIPNLVTPLASDGTFDLVGNTRQTLIPKGAHQSKFTTITVAKTDILNLCAVSWKLSPQLFSGDVNITWREAAGGGGPLADLLNFIHINPEAFSLNYTAALGTTQALHITGFNVSAGASQIQSGLTANISVPTWSKTIISDSNITGIPAGNIVQVSAPNTNPFLLAYAPVYDPTSRFLKPGLGNTVNGVTQGIWNGLPDSGYGANLAGTGAGTWQEDIGGGNVVTHVGALPQPDSAIRGSAARPACRMVTVWNRRFKGDIVIGVDAHAYGSNSTYQQNGGIAKIRFYCEGNYVDVTQRSMYYYTDPAGRTKAVEGFFITLRASDFTGAVASNGGTDRAFSGFPGPPIKWGVNVMVRAYANDPALQTQLIGGPAMLPAANGEASFTWYSRYTTSFGYAFRFFPDLIDYEYNINIRPSGNNVVFGTNASKPPINTANTENTNLAAEFKTLEDAMSWVNGSVAYPSNTAGTVTAPAVRNSKITIVENCNLTPAGNNSVGALVGYGFTTITTANGVNATIGGTIAKTGNWTVIGVTPTELRGPNITIDYAYLDGFTLSNREVGFWYNGIRAIHSIMGTDLTHLDRNRTIFGMGFSSASVYNGTWVTDCNLDYASLQYVPLVRGNYVNGSLGDTFSQSLCVVNNIIKETNQDPPRTIYKAIDLTYSGASTNAFVTTSSALNPPVPTNTLTLTDGANSVTSPAFNTFGTIQGVIDWVNINAANVHWTAARDPQTIQDDGHTDRFPPSLTSFNTYLANGVTPFNFGTSSNTHVAILATWIDVHGDWWQFGPGQQGSITATANPGYANISGGSSQAAAVTNVLVKNNMLANIGDTTTFRIDATNSVCYDVAFVNNAFKNGPNAFFYSITWSGQTDHVLLDHNEQIDENINILGTTVRWQQGNLNMIRNNIWGGGINTSGLLNGPFAINNHYTFAVPPTTSTVTEITPTVNPNGVTGVSLKPNRDSYDFSAGGILANTSFLAPPVAPYDLYGMTRPTQASRGSAEPYFGTKSLVKSDVLTLTAVCVDPLKTKVNSTGTVTYQWFDGPGNTGSLQTLTVTVTLV